MPKKDRERESPELVVFAIRSNDLRPQRMTR